ncbi:protocatechuate 3,4-dioxygenase subunit alpha [Microbacterium candidum]|uniref:Protocatechuate 3,4-dioxygenase subunit alpha n=1 Tax=Microbacterium candidum TaxID=3041922 RepID=A0ABT7MVK8_9MICO|nr:protocatechuate 3,4-dioxygenase subunit alpha [Microbacterium sp. ASV49]MDL9978482.1 protocatechuate 3,4-dioxygenase subunit alpha [Microbacterium sp. ASV49]
MLDPTAGQTVGPFFAYGTAYPKMHEVVHPFSPGAVLLAGTVYDGDGNPIPDAMIEIWGADADGHVSRARGAFRRDDHTFTGFGRSFTTDEGRYEFWTREPGGEASFFAAIVYARGLPDKLHTRIYLPGATDAFLSSLAEDERATLIATRRPDGSLHHDIRLQGENETVFLVF